MFPRLTPLGSKEFSDLVHYIRSGDFVQELLLESQDANEYAFALGALSHHASDIAGHPAVKQAVAIEYPKLLRYKPRIGPFKGLAFKSPTPQTEDMYFKSINTTVDQYRGFLQEIRGDRLVLPDCDLDSGEPTKAAEYSLADDAYAKLLAQLSDHKFDLTSPELRDHILQFYSDPSAGFETKKDSVRWQALLANLDQLKAATPEPVEAAGSAAR